MGKPLLLVVDYGDGAEFDQVTIEDLAHLLMQRQYGNDDFELHGVYAVGGDNQPVAVQHRVEGARDFDEESWAHPTVRVTMPDGSTLAASYTIDGRA